MLQLQAILVDGLGPDEIRGEHVQSEVKEPRLLPRYCLLLRAHVIMKDRHS